MELHQVHSRISRDKRKIEISPGLFVDALGSELDMDGCL